MILKRHKKFWMEVQEKWTEKWFKFITSQHHWELWIVSENPNITIEFIEEHPEYNWDWSDVSYNPSLTIKFIAAMTFKGDSSFIANL